MIGSSARLATSLDAGMLERRAMIYAPNTRLADLPEVTDLETQLGGRWLLRYLLAEDVHRLEQGTTQRQYVTPTPYAPQETIRWLALPAAASPRRYVLLLEPGALSAVYGPRWVRMGSGIEYVLDRGFGPEAIANISPDPGDSARWALEVS